jgi:hypothetical protein
VAFSLPLGLGLEMARDDILSTISSPETFTRCFVRVGAGRRVVEAI